MAEVEKAPKKSSSLRQHHRDMLYITAAVAVVFLAFGIGYGVANTQDDHMKVTNRTLFSKALGDGPVTLRSSAVGVGGSTSGTFSVHSGGEMGTSVSMADDNHFDGVVTAISGTSFTIGGHGASTSVATSSSTTYQGGNTVKANDTVIVEGTKTGDTITATKIIINP